MDRSYDTLFENAIILTMRDEQPLIGGCAKPRVMGEII